MWTTNGLIGRAPTAEPYDRGLGSQAPNPGYPETPSSPLFCAKAATTHHPNEIKFLAKWHMS